MFDALRRFMLALISPVTRVCSAIRNYVCGSSSDKSVSSDPEPDPKVTTEVKQTAAVAKVASVTEIATKIADTATPVAKQAPVAKVETKTESTEDVEAKIEAAVAKALASKQAEEEATKVEETKPEPVAEPEPVEAKPEPVVEPAPVVKPKPEPKKEKSPFSITPAQFADMEKNGCLKYNKEQIDEYTRLIGIRNEMKARREAQAALDRGEQPVKEFVQGKLTWMTPKGRVWENQLVPSNVAKPKSITEMYIEEGANILATPEHYPEYQHLYKAYGEEHGKHIAQLCSKETSEFIPSQGNELKKKMMEQRKAARTNNLGDEALNHLKLIAKEMGYAVDHIVSFADFQINQLEAISDKVGGSVAKYINSSILPAMRLI